MTTTDIIKEVQDKFCEYLEMSDNPDKLVSGILATKIIKLMNHIQYLERRLENESRKVRVN